MKSKYIFVAVLLLVFFGLTLGSSLSESPISDEPGHISTGVLYVKFGNLTFNSGSPLLANVLSAYPLITFFRSLRVPLNNTYFQEGYLPAFGKAFLMANKEHIGDFILLARLPTMVAGILLGLLIYLWIDEWYGFSAALLGLALYVFEPNFLANSHYAATDVLFALLFISTLYFLHRYLNKAMPLDLVLFVLSFVLGQLTKNTALILFPICFLIFFFYARNYSIEKKIIDAVYKTFLLIIAAWFGINAFYGFRDLGKPVAYYLSHDPSVTNSQYPMNLIQSSLPFRRTNFAGISNYLFNSFPLPLSYQYVKTLGWVYFRSRIPQPGFLSDHYFNSGWILYFPMTIAFKMPIVLIVLTILSICSAITSVRSLSKKELTFIVLPFILSSLGLLFSHIETGYRLMLFVVPLCIVFAAKIIVIKGKYIKLITVFAFLQGLMTLSIFPNFLGYANFIQAPEKYKYLTDSNLDWGQDIGKFATYVRQNNLALIKMNLFGVTDTELYGVPYNTFGPSWIQDKNNCEPMSEGTYAVSATQLNGTFLKNHSCFNWLLKKGRLIDVIGSSIYIIRI